jgi:CheY-like chemotaxis protein
VPYLLRSGKLPPSGGCGFRLKLSPRNSLVILERRRCAAPLALGKLPPGWAAIHCMALQPLWVVIRPFCAGQNPYIFLLSRYPLLMYWCVVDWRPGGAMRILIADDHEVIRSSVIRVLQSRGDVEECAEATNGKEAVEKALEWKPDLILLDVRLPVLCGFDAAKEIKQQAPDIPIVLFSIHNTQEILEQARLVGDGFILKDKIVEMLPNAIDALRRKQQFFPSDHQTEPDT